MWTSFCAAPIFPPRAKPSNWAALFIVTLEN